MKMPSRWDSGIIVWQADGEMRVLKEGVDGVCVVDPNQKGCPVVFEYRDIMFAEHYKGRAMGTKSRIPRAALGAAIGGMPGAVWLGLAGSAGKGEWKLRVKENNDGEDRIYSCRNQYDAKKMEKRIMCNHAHRYQPGKPPSSPAPTKRQRVNSRNNAPVPPVGRAGMTDGQYGDHQRAVIADLEPIKKPGVSVEAEAEIDSIIARYRETIG